MLSQMENSESCRKARANSCRNPVVVRRLRRRYHITPMKGNITRRGPLTIRNTNSSIPALLPPSPPLKPCTALRHVTETLLSQSHQAEPTTQRLRLPRVLAKPSLREVHIQAIENAYPELQGVTAEYIREHLPLAGIEMLAATQHINSRPPTSALPKELEIVMNHIVAAAYPTHMFAVYGGQPSPWHPQQSKRKVTLFAAHHLVFAANCAHLPVLNLQSPMFSSDEESTQTMTVPVVPLCLPSPETFPLLQAYLYTKQPQILMNALASLPPAPSSPEPVTTLTQRAILVHGLWENGCALGIVDDVFWKTVQILWEGILKTFGSGVGGKVVQVPQ